MVKRWRFGLVGVGRGSGYGRLLATDPRCEIVGCCDASEGALARFQRELELPEARCFTDYDAFIGSVGMDAVFIGTPMPVHAEQTVKAVQAGVSVLSEVTAASTMEGCRRIVEAVRRTGRLYMLAENCCYWPFVQEWGKLVQSGRLGEIIYSECEYLHPIPDLVIDPATGEPRWRAGRAPLHYCSHSLGPILEITQDRVVRAMGLGNGHRIMPDHPVVGTIDIQVALFETERGAIIKLARSSMVPRHPMMHYYTLQGTKGFVETDRMGPTSGLLYVKGEMERAQPIPVSLTDVSLPEAAGAGGHGTAEYGVVQDFLRALETGERPRLDVVRAMDLTAPGLVAHESAMKGGVWMAVPSFA
jgi:predicted dehydrogenase